MAHIKNNPIMHGASGMLGDVVVFRQVGGKTVMANRPRKPRFQSARQKEHRLRFKQAVAFARNAMRDEQKKEYYKALAPTLNLTNAYTAALTTYMRTGGKPEFAKIQTCLHVTKKDAVLSRKVVIPTSFAEQFRLNYNAVAVMLLAMLCFWLAFLEQLKVVVAGELRESGAHAKAQWRNGTAQRNASFYGFASRLNCVFAPPREIMKMLICLQLYLP